MVIAAQNHRTQRPRRPESSTNTWVGADARPPLLTRVCTFLTPEWPLRHLFPPGIPGSGDTAAAALRRSQCSFVQHWATQIETFAQRGPQGDRVDGAG